MQTDNTLHPELGELQSKLVAELEKVTVTVSTLDVKVEDAKSKVDAVSEDVEAVKADIAETKGIIDNIAKPDVTESPKNSNGIVENPLISAKNPGETL